VTPSITSKPERSEFSVVAARTLCLTSRPLAIASTYPLFTRCVAVLGVPDDVISLAEKSPFASLLTIVLIVFASVDAVSRA